MIELWSESDDWCLHDFLKMVEEEDLARALFALEGVEEAKQEEKIALLQEWAAKVSLFQKGNSPLLQWAALKEILIGELGFQGNETEYYASQNSDLAHVLESKQGLPILLACIWKLVGSYASIPIEGIALPGHFILRLGTPSSFVYVDPFFKGKLVSEEENKKRVLQGLQGKVPWKEHYLQPVTTKAWITRIIRNLMNSLLLEQNYTKLFRLARFFSKLHPENPEIQMTYAKLAELVGAFHFAQEVYEELLLKNIEDTDHFASSHHLSLLLNKMNYLN